MSDKNINIVANCIQDRHAEIQYNEKKIAVNGKLVKIEIAGKINCAVLNSKVSSLVCSKLMDTKDWPRFMDPDICDKCNCKIHKSIKKNMAFKNEYKSNS